jgi:hypothetical protein
MDGALPVAQQLLSAQGILSQSLAPILNNTGSPRFIPILPSIPSIWNTNLQEHLNIFENVPRFSNLRSNLASNPSNIRQVFQNNINHIIPVPSSNGGELTTSNFVSKIEIEDRGQDGVYSNTYEATGVALSPGSRAYYYPTKCKLGYYAWRSERQVERHWFRFLQEEWSTLDWAKGHPFPSKAVLDYWFRSKDKFLKRIQRNKFRSATPHNLNSNTVSDSAEPEPQAAEPLPGLSGSSPPTAMK